MKKTRHTEEQIAFALNQAATGTSVAEVIRRMGISKQTFYRWKKVYGGFGVGELWRLKLLEEEIVSEAVWRKVKAAVEERELSVFSRVTHRRENEAIKRDNKLLDRQSRFVVIDTHPSRNVANTDPI